MEAKVGAVGASCDQPEERSGKGIVERAGGLRGLGADQNGEDERAGEGVWPATVEDETVGKEENEQKEGRGSPVVPLAAKISEVLMMVERMNREAGKRKQEVRSREPAKVSTPEPPSGHRDELTEQGVGVDLLQFRKAKNDGADGEDDGDGAVGAEAAEERAIGVFAIGAAFKTEQGREEVGSRDGEQEKVGRAEIAGRPGGDGGWRGRRLRAGANRSRGSVRRNG